MTTVTVIISETVIESDPTENKGADDEQGPTTHTVGQSECPTVVNFVKKLSPRLTQ